MHADQVTVSSGTARALVAGQFPRWAHLPITPVDSGGTVNAIVRIGDRLVARFPLRGGDVDAVRLDLAREADAGRRLAGRTAFATPEPVALGAPGPGYPLPWSVWTWLPGTTATDAEPDPGLGDDLAAFVAGVRGLDTRGETFRGTGRGGDLRAHDPWLETCFRRSEHLLDVPSLRWLWGGWRDLPRSGPDLMTHGDLIPGNVLVANGRLAGVLDVGGLGPADPALDLVGAWHLLDAEPRRAFRERLGCGDLEWDRGRAWAFAQAMGLVWYYVESNPALSRTGRSTLRRLLAER